MKMILSSCDFSNPNSKQVILDNLDKKLCECKVLFIPNQKATYEKIHSDKYYDRLIECGFGKRENIYIFDESESEKFKNRFFQCFVLGKPRQHKLSERKFV